MAYYNPHACLTRGEQIIENSLKFLFRNHHHCMPDVFFKFAACMCVDCSYMSSFLSYSDLFLPPQCRWGVLF